VITLIRTAVWAIVVESKFIFRPHFLEKFNKCPRFNLYSSFSFGRGLLDRGSMCWFFRGEYYRRAKSP